MASLSIRRCSEMYAIIETGGKQIKVTERQEVYVEKVAADQDETLTFVRVLFVGRDDVKVGSPYVDGSTVRANVARQGLQKEISVFKYKPKNNYSRKQGHSQPYTKLVVDKINL